MPESSTEWSHALKHILLPLVLFLPSHIFDIFLTIIVSSDSIHSFYQSSSMAYKPHAKLSHQLSFNVSILHFNSESNQRVGSVESLE